MREVGIDKQHEIAEMYTANLRRSLQDVFANIGFGHTTV